MNGSTTLVSKKDDSGGFLDFIKNMIEGMLAPFKWLLDFKFLLDYKTLLLNIFRLFGVGGPLAGILVGSAAIVWLAEQLKDYFRENVAHMDKLSPEKAAELLQTPGSFREIEKYGGREAVLKIAKEGHLEAQKILDTKDIKKINEAGGEDFLRKVVARGAVTVPEETAKEDLSQFKEQGPKRPKGTGSSIPSEQAKWDKLWSKIYEPETGVRLDLLTKSGAPALIENQSAAETARLGLPPSLSNEDQSAAETSRLMRQGTSTATPLPSGAESSNVGAISGSNSPPMVETETPSMTPVSNTPATNRMNDVITENQDLNLNDYFTPTTGSAPAIVSSKSSSVDLPDRPIPATATVRDTTPIFDYVLKKYLSPV
jgi:hypothetical protein